MAEQVASWLKMSGAKVGAGGVRRCADSCLKENETGRCVSFLPRLNGCRHSQSQHNDEVASRLEAKLERK